jgi:tetratricopeptide (TPR) repeat protein
MLLYSTKNLASSLNCITEAIAILESQKTPNSALAMFYQGLGAILTKQGSYQASVSPYIQCHQTACRVGNDAIGLQACANLSLSFSRLGEYKQALEWAHRAFACDLRETAPHSCLPAVHSAVLSYAMLGMNAQAEAAIRKWSQEFGNFGSAARSQGWTLYTADGYAILGKMEEAQEQGLRATSGVNNDVHTDRYVGPYARWVARVSMHLRNASHGYEKLDKLASNLKGYDAIDKAEILNARMWLGAKIGKVSSGELANMEKHLAALPSAVREQLGRMGMLDFD